MNSRLSQLAVAAGLAMSVEGCGGQPSIPQTPDSPPISEVEIKMPQIAPSDNATESQLVCTAQGLIAKLLRDQSNFIDAINNTYSKTRYEAEENPLIQSTQNHVNELWLDMVSKVQRDNINAVRVCLGMEPLTHLSRLDANSQFEQCLNIADVMERAHLAGKEKPEPYKIVNQPYTYRVGNLYTHGTTSYTVDPYTEGIGACVSEQGVEFNANGTRTITYDPPLKAMPSVAKAKECLGVGDAPIPQAIMDAGFGVAAACEPRYYGDLYQEGVSNNCFTLGILAGKTEFPEFIAAQSDLYSQKEAFYRNIDPKTVPTTDPQTFCTDWKSQPNYQNLPLAQVLGLEGHAGYVEECKDQQYLTKIARENYEDAYLNMTYFAPTPAVNEKERWCDETGPLKQLCLESVAWPGAEGYDALMKEERDYWTALFDCREETIPDFRKIERRWGTGEYNHNGQHTTP